MSFSHWFQRYFSCSNRLQPEGSYLNLFLSCSPQWSDFQEYKVLPEEDKTVYTRGPLSTTNFYYRPDLQPWSVMEETAIQSNMKSNAPTCLLCCIYGYTLLANHSISSSTEESHYSHIPKNWSNWSTSLKLGLPHHMETWTWRTVLWRWLHRMTLCIVGNPNEEMHNCQ